MAKVKNITEKKALSGNKRSHAMNATRRKWNINLQKATVMIDGKPTKIIATAREIRSLRKANA